MKRGIRGLHLTFLFIMFLIFPVNAIAGAPLESIQGQVNKVLDVLRDPALKADTAKEAKEKRLWAIADGIFEYTELSKRTLGRNWKKLNPEQQKEFTGLFSKLLGDVYMDRIMAYTDEKVVFEKESMLSENRAEVQSKVITSSAEIPIHYRLIMKNAEWKVYDVIIEGVSLIKNYRSQFRDILSKKSPEDLLEILRKKVGEA